MESFFITFTVSYFYNILYNCDIKDRWSFMGKSLFVTYIVLFD